MEHKRDATVAGLGWPSTSNRGTSSTDPDTRPGYQTFELSAPDASPPTTSITSASLESNIALNNPGTTSPMDTYSAPTQPGAPFPNPGVPPSMFSTTLASHHEWSIRSTSRSLLTPTTPGVIHWRDSNLGNLQMSWSRILFLRSLWQLGVVFTDCGLLAPSLWDSSSTLAPSFHNADEPSLTTRLQELANLTLWRLLRHLGNSMRLGRWLNAWASTMRSKSFYKLRISLLNEVIARMYISFLQGFSSTGVLPTPQAKLFQNQTSLYARYVCVYHLNRCKTSHWFFTNLQGDTAFHWDCVQRSYQWNGISSLASWTYLHFFVAILTDMARGQA